MEELIRQEFLSLAKTGKINDPDQYMGLKHSQFGQQRSPGRASKSPESLQKRLKVSYMFMQPRRTVAPRPRPTLEMSHEHRMLQLEFDLAKTANHMDRVEKQHYMRNIAKTPKPISGPSPRQGATLSFLQRKMQVNKNSDKAQISPPPLRPQRPESGSEEK